MRSHYSCLLSALFAMLLAGCAATGHNFDPDKLSSLTPGVTTLQEAAYALTAPPDRIYPQTDGTTIAMWSHKITFVADGLYSRKEALLQFGPDGRLLRLVDSTNILLEPWERQKLLGPAPLADAGQPSMGQPGMGQPGMGQPPVAPPLAIPVPQAPPALAESGA